MATARDKVLHYLRNARTAEYGLMTLLAAGVALAPRGEYERRLESQRRRSREREFRLTDRLNELGARSGLGELGLDTVRMISGQSTSLALLPLQLLRGASGEERLLENARDLCGSAAMLAADYRALEQVAHASRDETTAKLAVDLRSEADDVASQTLESLDRLADALITGEIGGERIHRVGGVRAWQTLRLPQLRESLYRLRDEAADALRSARRGSPRMGARNLIPGYDTLPAEEICNRLSGLSQAELATVEAYERTTRNRPAILERVQTLRSQEPWAGYDEMHVSKVRERLRDADPDWVRQVLEYERGHKGRISILEAPEVYAATG